MKNGNFAVGTCVIRLSFHGNRSLKGKRAFLNRIKSRVKNSFNVSIAEVGDADSLQTALLAATSVSNDRTFIEGQFEKMIEFISGITEAEIGEVQTFIEIKGSNDNVFLQKG